MIQKSINNLYYQLKPLIPRSCQISLRRGMAARKRRLSKAVWPIDEQALLRPPNWPGWPENKRFSLVLTHDVDTAKGLANCEKLLRLEQDLGVRSSFNFVPERYQVCPKLRTYLTREGFEVGVHGLNHDGKLYASKNNFLHRAARINEYLKDWQAVGFRSPAMHHNLDWIGHLNIEYDASTFDTDPFEPQSDGVGTIFPFWVENNHKNGGYVELPYTLPQDFTLFVLLKENNFDVWKNKLDWLAEHGGMALMNTHPDYMNFSNRPCQLEEFPVSLYKDFLDYVTERYRGQYWNPLPREIGRFVSSLYSAQPSENADLKLAKGIDQAVA